MCYTLIWGGGHHIPVSTFTAVPCSHHTVTDTEPQNVSHSIKACRLQQIRAVKAKHWRLSITPGIYNKPTWAMHLHFHTDTQRYNVILQNSSGKYNIIEKPSVGISKIHKNGPVRHFF